MGTFTKGTPAVVATTKPRTPDTASGAEAGYHAAA